MKGPTGDKKTACLPPKQPQNSWKRASLDSKIMVCSMYLSTREDILENFLLFCN